MAEQVKRSEIDAKYKWNLNDIVNGDDAWEALFEEVKGEIHACDGFKGKLADEKELLACMNAEAEVSKKIERLFAYARMKRDEDGNDPKYQAMTARAYSLIIEFSTLTTFIVPELTQASAETLYAISEKPEFACYKYSIAEMARSKERVLSEKEETLLSGVRNFSGDFDTIFSMFDDVDIRFGKVKDENGEETELTQGRYGLFLQNPNQEVRKGAFEAMFNAYKNMINTVAAIYGGAVKKDVFFSKIRGYESALQSALDHENIDEKVYNNLIEAVHDALPAMHEYINFRKETMGLEELHMYDLHVPIVKGAEIAVEYEEACKMVKEALVPLGEDYADLLDQAYNNGWIDVHENAGKRTGAYSWGAYGSHPYVLLNYQKTTHNIFTLAHELGHAMHSYYSNENQPYPANSYVIFLAEIASTCNEVLMLKHLLKNCTDKSVKKFLLSYYLDMFRTTVFRQTQFAEFEKVSHGLAENGQPLTHEALSNAYYEINKQYYGEGVIHDDLIKYEWARIPHFYRAFYVYKYATGLISAVAIANRILTEGEPAVRDYKKFLSAGGSTSPLEILSYAGVDLTEKSAFEVALKEFKDTLDELKKL